MCTIVNVSRTHCRSTIDLTIEPNTSDAVRWDSETDLRDKTPLAYTKRLDSLIAMLNMAIAMLNMAIAMLNTAIAKLGSRNL